MATLNLNQTVPCPFHSCESYDTEIIDKLEGGAERHHCNRCERNFQVQRDSDREWKIQGTYAE